MISTRDERHSAADAPAKMILMVGGGESHSIDEQLENALTRANLRLKAVSTREEAVNALQQKMPDLLVIDVHLPDVDAMEVLYFVRARSSVPIIMMGSQAENKRLIGTLEAGADDYVFTPFNPDELIARIRALLRRVERMPATESHLMVRGLEIDLARRHVSLHGRKLHLTPTEYDILAALMRSPGQTLSHDALLQMVWGETHSGDYSVLRVNISRLRQRLDENPRHPAYIVTVPGAGYMMPLQPD